MAYLPSSTRPMDFYYRERMKKTLLELAREKPAKVRSYQGKHNENELLDLALAYFKGELGTTAIAKALGFQGGQAVYGAVASCLRRACDNGIIKIVSTKKS